MDQSENGQEERVLDYEEYISIKSDRSDRETEVRSGEEIRSEQPAVTPKAKWQHDRELNNDSLVSQLKLLKIALENVIESHESELGRLKSVVNPYRK